MERKDELEARVRETPLSERLSDCRKRIGKMCSEGRPPRMCIPVQWDDDDFYISTTLADAQRALDAERESLSKRCMCEHEWDADGVLISRSECFYHAEQTTQLAALQAQLRQVEGELAYANECRVAAASMTDQLQLELSTLRQLVEAHAKQLTELTIIPIGCSREQELRWTQSIKDLRATLDATTPDSNQLGDINDMVSKGGDGE